MGEKSQNSNQLNLINPATEELIAEIKLMDVDLIQKKVELSRTAFLTWKHSRIAERKNVILLRM